MSGSSPGSTSPPPIPPRAPNPQLTDEERAEAQFQLDLEKAMDASMETLSIENARRENLAIPNRKSPELLFGRGERSSSLSEEGAVVTTEVRPRSRPEGRRLDHPTSLPPPPSLGKRRVQSFDMAGNQNQDLMSFMSPSPHDKKESLSSKFDLEDINFNQESSKNNLQRGTTAPLANLKAVQNLFASEAPRGPAPAPIPRTILPVQHNGTFSYPSLRPNINHQLPHMSMSPPNQQQANQPNLQQQNPPNLQQNQPNLSSNYPHPGFIAGQSMFNQTISRPTMHPSHKLPAGQTSSNAPPAQFAVKAPFSNFLSSVDQGGMVKSASWNEATSLATTKPNKSTRQPTTFEETKPNIRKSASSNNLDNGVLLRKHFTKTKENNDSLIDLDNHNDLNITRVSILEFFDPLAESSEPVDEDIYCAKSDTCSSFYEAHDPFEYMTAQALSTTDAPDGETPKLPPRGHTRQDSKDYGRRVGVVKPNTSSVPSLETIKRRRKTAQDYENVVKKEAQIFECKKRPAVAVDSEAMSFVDMVREVRRGFKFDDRESNPGMVLCARVDASYLNGTEVKVVVYHKESPQPIVFTAAVDSEVEMIVVQVLVEVDPGRASMAGQYLLQVHGAAEYIVGGTLSQYEYVHQCYKYDRDVTLTLVLNENVVHSLARTSQDDEDDCNVGLGDISPMDQMKTLSYDDLEILMTTLNKEGDRISHTARNLASCSEKEVMKGLRPRQMLQAVKAVCALLGGVETLDLSEVCDQLITECLKFDQAKGNEDPTGRLRPEIVAEVGERYAMVTIGKCSDYQTHATEIESIVTKIKDRVQAMIFTYARTFRVDFELEQPGSNISASRLSSESGNETLLVRVNCVHRLDPNWNHTDYRLDLMVYHGTRPIGVTLSTKMCPPGKGNSHYERVVVEDWLEVQQLPISMVPLEARLVLSLVGRDKVTDDKGDSFTYTELGWCALQMYSHDRNLAQGRFLLPLWPVEARQQIGPAPDPGSHPSAETCPLVSIVLPELGGPVTLPTAKASITNQDLDISQLDHNTQQQLIDYCEQDILAFKERPFIEREIVWEKRHYLRGVAGALPKVLLAARSWDPASLPDLYGLLETWPRPDTTDLLQLFLPIFPDTRVRAAAIKWLDDMDSDELEDYLPQMVEAVKHETWNASPLARLLLERSLRSPRLAHSLYWLLTQALPSDGHTPQNMNMDGSTTPMNISVARYHRRLQLLLRAVIAVVGRAVRNRFMAQQVLMKSLDEAASQVKDSKDSARQMLLTRHMEQLHHLLVDTPTLIPLSASQVAAGADVKNCTFFNSNTVPLKLVLNSAENDGGFIKAIYKVGDDLRQDMLTVQMIRVMDRIWLRSGLDLRMVTFRCVSTGWRAGFVEFVDEADTLREIQVADTITGTFKPETLNDWLRKKNPSQLEFQRAVNNFTRSCAGYSVVTYVLGIGDRHNDNIMVKSSGHLFHIDFGKFLGDAQMFGNIKRDRAPFVLTPDMVYVINGGERMTEKFHTFVDLCCSAFNTLRRHGNLLLSLFALMATSGIPGVTNEAVSYIQRTLHLDLSNAEAAARFARLIQESMGSMSTQFNFFIHNLAQLKFGGESATADSETLSFIPKKYTMKQEGRIIAVEVHGIQKRYNPEKYYLFILRVKRSGHTDPSYLFRTYKEFCELHSRMCTRYPLSKFHSLPKGLSIGRSEVREVAEKRKKDIGAFLQGLFQMSEEICHSDLVYTFFHPLLRDQEDTSIHTEKLKEPKGHQQKFNVGRIQGRLKLSISYKQDTLLVMVHHIQNLNVTDQTGEEPNSYVKIYLHPDPAKQTKRKTKVVKKNCNPSFMEMLEYRIPLDVVKCKKVQATVWDNSRFQENMFLGAITVSLDQMDLTKETLEWYPLGQFYR